MQVVFSPFPFSMRSRSLLECLLMRKHEQMYTFNSVPNIFVCSRNGICIGSLILIIFHCKPFLQVGVPDYCYAQSLDKHDDMVFQNRFEPCVEQPFDDGVKKLVSLITNLADVEVQAYSISNRILVIIQRESTDTVVIANIYGVGGGGVTKAYRAQSLILINHCRNNLNKHTICRTARATYGIEQSLKTKRCLSTQSSIYR